MPRRPTAILIAVLSTAATLTSFAEPIPDNPLALQVRAARQAELGFNAILAAQQDPANSSELTVYVPDSAKALEQFRLAERLESQREWGKAADVYQEIVDALGDRVMPVPNPAPADPKDPPTATSLPPLLPRYETVARQVERKLAAWPADGLRAYRLRYDAAATDLLNSPGSSSESATLSSVIDRYFVTSASLRAALQLIDLRLESGDLTGALTLATRILSSHPLAQVGAPNDAELSGRAGVLLRAAVAAAWSGNADAAKSFLAELASNYPAAKGTLSGSEVSLSAEAARLAQLPLSQLAATPIAGWRTPGGDVTRSRVSAATAKPSARVALIEVPDIASPRANRAFNNAIVQQQLEAQSNARRDGALSVMLPSASDEQLFFQDGSRLFAVSVESGIPLPGWAATYPSSSPASPAGVYTIPRPIAPTPNHQYSLTLTDDSVLAVMGFSDLRIQQFTGIPATPSAPRLVRLDRTTGRVIWEASPRQFTGDNEALKTLELSGSPLVLGDAVYLAARGSKGNQFDDAYVLCFDYATGRLRWATYVASSAGALRAFIDGSLGTQTVTHLAAAGGRIILQTNLGAIASLDALSGRPEWISLYRRDAVTENSRGRVWNPRLASMSGAIRPWAYNPPILSGGLIYSLPTDSQDLLILDAATGQTLKSIPTGEFDSADVLIHADADRVIIAASNAVYAVEWQKHLSRPLKPNEEGSLLWRSDLAGSPLRGRPFITNNTLFVPTAARLIQIDPRGGKTLGSTPDFKRTWEPEEGQGNVVAIADHLVIAGSKRVEIFTDLDLAEARYKQEITEKPNLPGPRLRWAEVMFNAGKTDQAIALIDEAIPLILGSENPSNAAADRLFTSAISMADALIRQAGVTAGLGNSTSKLSQTLADQTAALYDRAAKVARTPGQQVEWRRRRAETLAATGDYAAAVQLWQQVLSEPSWRSVRVSDDNPGNLSDGARLARQQIDAIIKKSPAAYAPIDALADTRLASTTEPAALVALAQTFPNSAAAPRALLSAAEQFESASELASAARVLRELFVAYPNFTRRADVAESMARVYAAIPGRADVALSRLAMGSRLFPNHKLAKPILTDAGTPLFPAGTNPTFAAAADQLRALLTSRSGRSLPDFRLPSDEQTRAFRAANNARIKPVTLSDDKSIPRVLSIIEPLPNGARTDRIVVQRPQSELSLVDPAAGVVWTAKSPGPLTRGCAFVGEHLLAWDDNSVAAYATATGTLLWRLETAGLPALEVARGLFEAEDPGDPNAQNQVLQNGVRRTVLRPGMPARNFIAGANLPGANLPQLAGIDGRGQPLAEQISLVALAGERLILSTASGRLICLSPASGQILWQTRPNPTTPLRLLASEDFAVTLSGDEGGWAISALDADTGVVAWRRTTSDATRQPLAAALSPDGILLYTLIDRICVKDLFEPGENLTFETPSDPAAPFAGMDRPEQLAVSEGLLLAATDQGQFIRAFVIADQCKPLRFPARKPGAEPVQALFPTLARVPNGGMVLPTISLHFDGTKMYVLSSRALVAYDLRNGIEHWKQSTDATATQFADVFIGQNELLVTSRSAPDQPASDAKVLAMSRKTAPDSGRESGARLHEFPLPAKSLVKQVQPITGGIYFLAIDGTLHFAAGNGTPPAPPTPPSTPPASTTQPAPPASPATPTTPAP